MTKFLDKSFSVPMGGDQSYRDNWEATFGKRATPMPSAGVSMCECGFPHGCHMPDCPCFIGPVPATRGPSEARTLQVGDKGYAEVVEAILGPACPPEEMDRRRAAARRVLAKMRGPSRAESCGCGTSGHEPYCHVGGMTKPCDYCGKGADCACDGTQPASDSSSEGKEKAEPPKEPGLCPMCGKEDFWFARPDPEQQR